MAARAARADRRALARRALDARRPFLGGRARTGRADDARRAWPTRWRARRRARGWSARARSARRCRLAISSTRSRPNHPVVVRQSMHGRSPTRWRSAARGSTAASSPASRPVLRGPDGEPTGVTEEGFDLFPAPRPSERRWHERWRPRSATAGCATALPRSTSCPPRPGHPRLAAAERRGCPALPHRAEPDPGPRPSADGRLRRLLREARVHDRVRRSLAAAGLVEAVPRRGGAARLSTTPSSRAKRAVGASELPLPRPGAGPGERPGGPRASVDARHGRRRPLDGDGRHRGRQRGARQRRPPDPDRAHRPCDDRRWEHVRRG